MLIIISPAKTLDFSTTSLEEYTIPNLLDHSQELIDILKKYKIQDLEKLMSVSSKIAELNYQRFQDFNKNFTITNSKQALLAFKGDVYQGFDLEKYNKKDFDFAQNHLRILSGLYGLLRPLDLMQAYRLEMGTDLKNHKGKNLYEFWGDTITNNLENAIHKQGDNILVNLASNEYFKSINTKLLKNIQIITPSFKQFKNGEYKMIALFAKKARGLMSDYIIRNRINNINDLLEFDFEQYSFNPELTKNQFSPVFTRKQA